MMIFSISFLLQIFAIDRRQLVNFLPIGSIPQGLGGTLPHRHIDWLRTCFDRLGSPVLSNGNSATVTSEEDYFNPMKALPPASVMLSRRMSFNQPSQRQQLYNPSASSITTTTTLDRHSSQRSNQVHHFPHQRMLVNGMNGARTISTIPARRGKATSCSLNQYL